MKMDRVVAASYVGLIVITASAAYLPIPVWLQMLPMTLLIIIIGAKNTTLKGEGMVMAEQMKTKDAYMFPVIGSCVLFSLFLVFKFLNPDYINVAVKIYFFVFGLLVVGAKVSQIGAITLPPALVERLTARTFAVRIPCCKADKQEDKDKDKAKADDKEKKEAADKAADTAATATTSSTDAAAVDGAATAATPAATPADDKFVLEFTLLDIVAHLVSVALGVWYIATNHWAASNLFGIAFSIQGIEVISLGSYFNGFILLCGLFVYDIFWVFGTTVMVTVAKSLDAPIKLLFPQHGVDASGNPLRPSLLGLGDIVIPGIYIALLLRFDLWLAECAAVKAANARAAAAAAAVSGSGGSNSSEAAPVQAQAAHSVSEAEIDHAIANARTPYFHTVLVFYVIGLATTLFVMYQFQAAQPALLYLVPACLISAFGTAAVKGQLKELWTYKEADPNEEEEKEKKKA